MVCFALLHCNVSGILACKCPRTTVDQSAARGISGGGSLLPFLSCCLDIDTYAIQVAIHAQGIDRIIP